MQTNQVLSWIEDEHLAYSIRVQASTRARDTASDHHLKLLQWFRTVLLVSRLCFRSTAAPPPNVENSQFSFFCVHDQASEIGQDERTRRPVRIHTSTWLSRWHARGREWKRISCPSSLLNVNPCTDRTNCNRCAITKAGVVCSWRS